MKTNGYTKEQVRRIHIGRAKDFNALLGNPFLSDTERVTLERLRDQRLQLAEDLDLVK